MGKNLCIKINNDVFDKRVQELLFANGYKWNFGSNEYIPIKDITKSNYPCYLCVGGNDILLGMDSVVHTIHKLKVSKYKKLLKYLVKKQNTKYYILINLTKYQYAWLESSSYKSIEINNQSATLFTKKEAKEYIAKQSDNDYFKMERIYTKGR